MRISERDVDGLEGRRGYNERAIYIYRNMYVYDNIIMKCSILYAS